MRLKAWSADYKSGHWVCARNSPIPSYSWGPCESSALLALGSWRGREVKVPPPRRAVSDGQRVCSRSQCRWQLSRYPTTLARIKHFGSGLTGWFFTETS